MLHCPTSRFHAQVALTCAIVLTLALAACGGPANLADSQAQQLTPRSSAPALQLPAPAELARRVSLTDRDRVCLGSEFGAALPLQRVTASGNFAAFDAAYTAGGSFDTLGYATYAFNLVGFDGTALSMSWDALLPEDSLWLALSNYASARWDWFNVDPAAQFDVPSIAPYIDSESGTLFAVVLVAGEFQGQLQWIRWGGNVPPTAALAADPTSGDAPLNVAFDASASLDPDGTITKFEWDWNGDSVYDANGSEPTIEHLYVKGGNYMVKVRVTDGAGATATATRNVVIFAAKPMDPVAVLAADPTSGLIPLTVNFDASGSYDDQPITLYEWDLDGDGVYNETDNGEFDAKNHDTAQYIYTKQGTYTPSVRVTDTEFNTAEDSESISAEFHGWYIQTIDHLGGSGRHSSVAIINGNPAISYQRAFYGLYYIRANNADGTDWPEFSAAEDGQLDSYGGAGKGTSLQEVDGAPAVSYFCDIFVGDEPGEIKYIRATDGDGTAWNTPVVIESPTGTDSGYTSMAVVNGNPAICYRRYASGPVLRYVRADDAPGTSWPTPGTVYSTGSSGEFNTMLVVNGNPAISFRSDSSMKYIRAADADGSSWGAAVTVDDGGGWNAGYEGRMAIINGNPAISTSVILRLNPNMKLHYCRANDANGDTWGSPLELESTGVFAWSSLTTIDGVPVIACNDATTSGVLQLYRGNDAAGSSFGEPEPVTDNPGVDGGYTSMLTINGRTAIVYYRAPEGMDLMIAIYFP